MPVHRKFCTAKQHIASCTAKQQQLSEWASSQLGELLLAVVTTHHYNAKWSGAKIRKMTVLSSIGIVLDA
jgi:hypothetical protein